jgi:hypothetical protein
MILNIKQWDKEIQEKTKFLKEKGKNTIKLRGIKTLADGNMVCIVCGGKHKMYDKCPS